MIGADTNDAFMGAYHPFQGVFDCCAGLVRSGRHMPLRLLSLHLCNEHPSPPKKTVPVTLFVSSSRHTPQSRSRLVHEGNAPLLVGHLLDFVTVVVTVCLPIDSHKSCPGSVKQVSSFVGSKCLVSSK